MSENILEIKGPKAELLDMIANAPDDPHELIKIAKIKPEVIERFLLENKLMDDPVGKELLQASQLYFSQNKATVAKASAGSSMIRLSQSEIINQLADTSGLKKADVRGLFDSLAEMATKEVKKSGEFTLPGFGKFVKTKRKAREGRNPATGETIKIPAKTTVKFRASKAMKDAVAGAK